MTRKYINHYCAIISHFSICCSICCVYPHLRELAMLPIINLPLETSVANERCGKIYFSHQPWPRTAGWIFPSHKLVIHQSLFLSIYRFVVARLLKEHSSDAQVFLLHKTCQPQIKIEGAIFHIANFNCEHCNLIGHLTFQMRKGLVTMEPPEFSTVWYG